MDLWFAKSVRQNAGSPSNSGKFLDVKQDILSESALLILRGSYWILQTRILLNSSERLRLIQKWAEIYEVNNQHKSPPGDIFLVGGRWRFSSKRL